MTAEQQKPPSQWREQIMAQANAQPLAQKFWDLEPPSNPYAKERDEVEVYEWPKSETR